VCYSDLTIVTMMKNLKVPTLSILKKVR